MKPTFFVIVLFLIASGSVFGQEKSVDSGPIKGVVVRGGTPGSNLRVINMSGKYQITFNSTETLADGTPLFRTKIVTGQILQNNSKPVTDAIIEIRQVESDDIVKSVADAQGNFNIELKQDNTHYVWVNGQNILKIKIDTSTGNSTE